MLIYLSFINIFIFLEKYYCKFIIHQIKPSFKKINNIWLGVYPQVPIPHPQWTCAFGIHFHALGMIENLARVLNIPAFYSYSKGRIGLWCVCMGGGWE